MIQSFTPIVWLLISAGILTAVMLAAAVFLGPKRPNPVKAEPFECGIVPTGDAGDYRIPVKFYLVAILFIIFDAEIIFLYPWAAVFRQLTPFAFVSIVVFIAVLMAGLFYAVKRGVMQWK